MNVIYVHSNNLIRSVSMHSLLQENAYHMHNMPIYIDT